MARTGKIARLPRALREQLNQRLQDGELGTRLIEWLNGLPDVQQVLEREFSGRPINEQNLSDWRQGGYHDWLRHQDSLTLVRQLADEAADLKEEVSHHSIADYVSPSLAVALAQCARQAAADGKDDPKQRRELLAVAQEVTKLRRGDHEQERLRIEREQWEAKCTEAESKKKSDATLAPFWDLILARQVASLFEDDMRKNGGTFPPELQAFLKRIGANPNTAANSFPKIDWPSISRDDKPNQGESS